MPALLNAQSVDITGTWTMFEMSITNGTESQKTSEDQMKTQGFMTDYYFMSDSKFKLISNMTGSGTMDTYEGTWKLADNKLTISLTVNGQAMDIVWTFDYKNNVMNLSRVSPDGSTTLVNTFRKKEA
jgi:hypothetical protein